MCNCIECTGDQPEPEEIETLTDYGYKTYISFKGIPLTDGYIDPKNAWNEFDHNLKRGFYTK